MDASLFLLPTADFVIMLLIYVNDIILTGSPNVPFVDLLASLSRDFSMKDLLPLHYFLGIEDHS